MVKKAAFFSIKYFTSQVVVLIGGGCFRRRVPQPDQWDSSVQVSLGYSSRSVGGSLARCPVVVAPLQWSSELPRATWYILS